MSARDCPRSLDTRSNHHVILRSPVTIAAFLEGKLRLKVRRFKAAATRPLANASIGGRPCHKLSFTGSGPSSVISVPTRATRSLSPGDFRFPAPATAQNCLIGGDCWRQPKKPPMFDTPKVRSGGLFRLNVPFEIVQNSLPPAALLFDRMC
jgi:hypothetical protein